MQIIFLRLILAGILAVTAACAQYASPYYNDGYAYPNNGSYTYPRNYNSDYNTVNRNYYYDSGSPSRSYHTEEYNNYYFYDDREKDASRRRNPNFKGHNHYDGYRHDNGVRRYSEPPPGLTRNRGRHPRPDSHMQPQVPQQTPRPKYSETHTPKFNNRRPSPPRLGNENGHSDPNSGHGHSKRPRPEIDFYKDRPPAILRK